MAEMQLIAAHFDRELTDEENARLEDWLGQSPDHVRAFVEWSAMESVIEEHYENQHAIIAHDDDTLWKFVRQSVLSKDKPDAINRKKEDKPWHLDYGLPDKTLTEDQRSSNGYAFKDAMGLLAYACGEAAKTKYAKRLGAIAAAILIAVIAWQIWAPATSQQGDGQQPFAEQQQPADPSAQEHLTPAVHTVATLTNDFNAQWQTVSGGIAPNVGDEFASGRLLYLTDGVAEITTGSGAVVTLQGPIEVRTHAEGRLELLRGKLIARCETPKSKGFTVFTDTAEVTDIGTVFGVERDAMGQTITGVLQGHVALSYKSGEDQPRLLKAGDIAGVSANGLAITTTPDDETQALSAWSKLLRPVRVTGDAVFVERMPTQLPEDEQLVRVYREPAGVLLQEDLIVSRTEPGLYRPTDPNQKSTLAAGTRVDSYYVHINRPRRPTDGGVTKQFTITFDQPVVALIVHTHILITTNVKFGSPGVTYPKAGGIGLLSKSGLDPDDPQVDSLQWSDDRKTLTVALSVEDADQFRVLTLSPQAASAEGLID